MLVVYPPSEKATRYSALVSTLPIRVSTETPRQLVPSFDHLVTQGIAAALGLLPVLLAAEGGEVEEVVGAARRLQAARVLRVGVEHTVVDLEEGAAAGHVVGLVGGLHALVAQRCVLVEGAEVVFV